MDGNPGAPAGSGSSEAPAGDEPTADGGELLGDAAEDASEPGDAAGTKATSAPELIGEDLAIGYPTTEEPVVECETVAIPAGEITALVGPNGSGKSTLLKSMADQLSPECGRILLDGADVQCFETKDLARKLGLLSQQNTAPDSITVEDLAYHGRYPHRGFFESVTEADREAVDRAIDLAGIEHLRDAEVGNLSGGQKQLAWIAMVLAQDTDVLLLDEPTTFLDLHHQLRVMEVVRTLNHEESVTVGIVLHDVGQAARFADNLIALKDGEPYDWGPPVEVVTEELLAEVFHVEASVDVDSPGGPHIAPERPLDE